MLLDTSVTIEITPTWSASPVLSKFPTCIVNYGRTSASPCVVYYSYCNQTQWVLAYTGKDVYQPSCEDLPRKYQLSPGSIFYYVGYDENQSQRSVTTYHEIGSSSHDHEVVLRELLVHIASPEAFNVLRTKEQLGYGAGVISTQDSRSHGKSESTRDCNHAQTRICVARKPYRALISELMIDDQRELVVRWDEYRKVSAIYENTYLLQVWWRMLRPKTILSMLPVEFSISWRFTWKTTFAAWLGISSTSIDRQFSWKSFTNRSNE